jgi:hypothetical protein
MNNWITSSGIATKIKNKEVEIKEDTQVTYKTTKVKVKKSKKGVVKNDGMNSHEVYTCRNVRTCYNLYLEKRMKDMSINCATKMYIKRSNGNIMRLKGVRR